jgi:hypothetical protein
MATDYEKQALLGTEVEKEHQKTYDWLIQCFRDDVAPSFHAFCYHIATDHLKERSDYYTKLEEAKL